MATTMFDREEKALERTLVSGSAVQALCGAAAAVLAIIGLTQVAPADMAAIAAIALGAAFLLDSGLLAAEFPQVLTRSGRGPLSAAELGGGLGAQAITGISAMMLGIIALLGMDSVTLLSITAIVLGSGTLLGSGVVSRFSAISTERGSENQVTQTVTRRAVSAAAGTQLLVGAGAVVLGILALLSFAPMVLTLTSMLGVGLASLLSGSAVSGRVLSAFGE
jgi:hypothetical protein